VRVVGRQLETYARRGVFRSFSRTGFADGKATFRFVWLWNQPFSISLDEARCTLRFEDLLPGVPARGELEGEIKTFLERIAAADRPEHRRLDPKRATVRYTSRRGTGSLAFRIADGDFEYGVQQAMNVVNELFLEFLNLHRRDYLVEHYQVSDE
jgi:hypothetical protein